MWNPDHRPRVGLLPRDGDPADVQWIDIDPCFVFHTLNAYDDGGRVVLDLCRYDKAYDVSKLRGPGPVTLDRWLIDPAGGKVVTCHLDDQHQEFPRIDDRRTGRRHRYGYSAVIGEGEVATINVEQGITAHEIGNAILKHDLQHDTVERHEFGDGATTGEFVFVPTTPDAAEDDGYVMGFVHNPDRGAADLVILSAQDFRGEPVARVHLPSRIPLGFHGNWIAER